VSFNPILAFGSSPLLSGFNAYFQGSIFSSYSFVCLLCVFFHECFGLILESNRSETTCVEEENGARDEQSTKARGRRYSCGLFRVEDSHKSLVIAPAQLEKATETGKKSRKEESEEREEQPTIVSDFVYQMMIRCTNQRTGYRPFLALSMSH